MVDIRFKLSNDDGMVNFVDFGTYDEALEFMGWFNNTRADKGKILFGYICSKLGKTIPKELVDTYHNLGYIDPIQFGMIYESNNSETGRRFRVCFPMTIHNFAQKENG